jgi:hypothetical protein
MAGIKNSILGGLPEAVQRVFDKLDLFRRPVVAMAQSLLGRDLRPSCGRGRKASPHLGA